MALKFIAGYLHVLSEEHGAVEGGSVRFGLGNFPELCLPRLLGQLESALDLLQHLDVVVGRLLRGRQQVRRVGEYGPADQLQRNLLLVVRLVVEEHLGDQGGAGADGLDHQLRLSVGGREQQRLVPVDGHGLLLASLQHMVVDDAIDLVLKEGQVGIVDHVVVDEGDEVNIVVEVGPLDVVGKVELGRVEAETTKAVQHLGVQVEVPVLGGKDSNWERLVVSASSYRLSKLATGRCWTCVLMVRW